MSNHTIEEKLKQLAACGLKLRQEFSVSDLERSWGREALRRTRL